jgi:hypothetical protein
MAFLLLAGYPLRIAVFAAIWLAAGLFIGPRAWAQTQAPTSSGLVIQPLGSGIPAGLNITLDGPRKKSEALVYTDGQLRSGVLTSINPNDITDIKVLNNSIVMLVAPGAANAGALFITTRQHATDKAVIAFNQRVAELQQQNKPVPNQAVRLSSLDIMPQPRMYVDGQLADSATVAAVNPIDIASVYVLKGAAAAALSPQAAGRGVVSIVSKRNAQKRRVRKFEQHLRQLEAANPTTPATIERDNALTPADVRYYLNGQLSSWAAVREVYQSIKSTRALRGRQAAAYAHDPAITEVFVVETNP